MKIQYLLFFAFAVFLLGCKHQPQNTADKPATNSEPVVHLNPFMVKYVDENINCCEDWEVEDYSKQAAKNGIPFSKENYKYTLYPDSTFIKGLNCTIYIALIKNVGDGTMYFLIRDNGNNQVYIKEDPSWRPVYRKYQPLEALTILKRAELIPLRTDLCEIESFINRSTALKKTILTTDLLDSLPIHRIFEKRIKDAEELDDFWNTISGKAEIDQKGGKELIKFLKTKLKGNALIYRYNNEIVYIDFIPSLADNKNFSNMTEAEKEAESKNVIKGNIYKLRVLQINFGKPFHMPKN